MNGDIRGIGRLAINHFPVKSANGNVRIGGQARQADTSLRCSQQQSVIADLRYSSGIAHVYRPARIYHHIAIGGNQSAVGNDYGVAFIGCQRRAFKVGFQHLLTVFLRQRGHHFLDHFRIVAIPQLHLRVAGQHHGLVVVECHFT